MCSRTGWRNLPEPGLYGGDADEELVAALAAADA